MVAARQVRLLAKSCAELCAGKGLVTPHWITADVSVGSESEFCCVPPVAEAPPRVGPYFSISSNGTNNSLVKT